MMYVNSNCTLSGMLLRLFAGLRFAHTISDGDWTYM
jgi:hypothetical protein